MVLVAERWIWFWVRGARGLFGSGVGPLGRGGALAPATPPGAHLPRPTAWISCQLSPCGTLCPRVLGAGCACPGAGGRFTFWGRWPRPATKGARAGAERTTTSGERPPRGATPAPPE